MSYLFHLLNKNGINNFYNQQNKRNIFRIRPIFPKKPVPKKESPRIKKKPQPAPKKDRKKNNQSKNTKSKKRKSDDSKQLQIGHFFQKRKLN